jgi:hypothetical protein
MTTKIKSLQHRGPFSLSFCSSQLLTCEVQIENKNTKLNASFEKEWIKFIRFGEPLANLCSTYIEVGSGCWQKIMSYSNFKMLLPSTFDSTSHHTTQKKNDESCVCETNIDIKGDGYNKP